MGLAVAAGLGALIGLEREHHRDKVVIAGVRTFPLFAIAGYLVGLLAQGADFPWVLAAGVGSMGALAVTFMVLRHQLGSTGLTTPAAMIVTFLLGAIVSQDMIQEAVVVGVGVTFLLLTKERLHRFAHILGDEEFLSALQFIAILFILFPLALAYDTVPGVPFVGRGDLIDPPKLLVLVLFVSALSFVSFLVMRAVGPSRGLEFSGFLGGLVNSEATATSLAAHSNANASLLRPAAAGVLLATSTMFVRNLAIAAFADPSLRVLFVMLVPCAAMAIVCAIFAWRERVPARVKSGERLAMKNPFAVGPAVKFVFVFAVLSVVSTLAQQRLGEVGVFAIALGGFVSAGAATATLATLYVGGKVSLLAAGGTAALATLIGAINKIVVLRAVGPDLIRRIKGPILATTAVGAAALLVTLAVAALRFG